ncbi:hypothetical protein GGTG_04666 [Gaeumannomyces tritici R3-111a-1]|uniref:Uncharacterized protein n=1 Tax=Gaeumannomyces tritici (strain R3-111a-1) TaxID=644352 RepID=J3NTR6_GAET3|nr:hypothetical protein GGTG_04666 [Gaeumannomyces tritici R3-111a-1]EJT79581.1 hypothetical protein GGTG_04666 [Gaeumannomyces tritici R3-111a-1]
MASQKNGNGNGNGNSNYQNPYSVDVFDIVATQGAFLVTPYGSPVHPSPAGHDEKFAKKLYIRLKSQLTVVQPGRAVKYGKRAAEESLSGHTPPEVRAEYDIRSRKRWQAFLEECSADDDDDDDDDGSPAKVDPQRGLAAPATAKPPSRPLTPSSSTLETPNSADTIPPAGRPSVAQAGTTTRLDMAPQKNGNGDGNGNSNYQNPYIFDKYNVVATQGAFLITPYGSPMGRCLAEYDEKFAKELHLRLKRVLAVGQPPIRTATRDTDTEEEEQAEERPAKMHRNAAADAAGSQQSGRPRRAPRRAAHRPRAA